MEFQRKLNEIYSPALLKDGYAPFCKHLFVKNFSQVNNSIIEITSKNEHLLKTAYESRTEKELPVLKRYFTKDSVIPGIASYLDIILYTKE